jgi:hypothetical protein
VEILGSRDSPTGASLKFPFSGLEMGSQIGNFCSLWPFDFGMPRWNAAISKIDFGIPKSKRGDARVREHYPVSRIALRALNVYAGLASDLWIQYFATKPWQRRSHRSEILDCSLNRTELNYGGWYMKRNILALLVFLFTVSVSGRAQQANVAKTVYDKWRQEAPADEVSNLGFAMATVTRRAGDEMAEVNLWVVGRSPEATIDVQPLYIEDISNGGDMREQAGGVTKTSIGSSDDGSGIGDNVGLKIIVPVRPNANALEIKWVGYDGDKILNSTTVVTFLLREGPSETLTKITASRWSVLRGWFLRSLPLESRK